MRAIRGQGLIQHVLLYGECVPCMGCGWIVPRHASPSQRVPPPLRARILAHAFPCWPEHGGDFRAAIPCTGFGQHRSHTLDPSGPGDWGTMAPGLRPAARDLADRALRRDHAGDAVCMHERHDDGSTVGDAAPRFLSDHLVLFEIPNLTRPIAQGLVFRFPMPATHKGLQGDSRWWLKHAHCIAASSR
jgi:hypothetical protein